MNDLVRLSLDDIGHRSFLDRAEEARPVADGQRALRRLRDNDTARWVRQAS